MRHSLSIVALFFVCMLAAQAAQATGNVLLPSTTDSNSTSSTPNLGIAPAATPVTATPATPTPPAAPAAPQVASPAQSSAPFGAAGASSPPPEKVHIPTIDDILSPVDTASAKKLPPGVLPTRVIHQPDSSAAMTEANANLPYTLKLSVSPQSVFGANDVARITNKLGLSHNQVASSCFLSVSGLMQTDKGGYVIDGSTAPPVTVHYDGTIKNYMLSAQAFCIADKLPPGSGFITEVGTRYVVPLQGITCPAPTRQTMQLTITYDGSAKAQCAYQ